MIIVMATKLMGWASIGRLMRQKAFHGLAPSTRAASRICGSIDLYAAESTVMDRPVQIQTPVAITA